MLIKTTHTHTCILATYILLQLHKLDFCLNKTLATNPFTHTLIHSLHCDKHTNLLTTYCVKSAVQISNILLCVSSGPFRTNHRNTIFRYNRINETWVNTNMKYRPLNAWYGHYLKKTLVRYCQNQTLCIYNHQRPRLKYGIEVTYVGLPSSIKIATL